MTVSCSARALSREVWEADDLDDCPGGTVQLLDTHIQKDPAVSGPAVDQQEPVDVVIYVGDTDGLPQITRPTVTVLPNGMLRARFTNVAAGPGNRCKWRAIVERKHTAGR